MKREIMRAYEKMEETRRDNNKIEKIENEKRANKCNDMKKEKRIGENRRE